MSLILWTLCFFCNFSASKLNWTTLLVIFVKPTNRVRSMLCTWFQKQHFCTLICLSIFLWTEIFETQIRNQNMIRILIFVRYGVRKKRKWHFMFSKGWQGRGILALWENVHLPVKMAGTSFGLLGRSSWRGLGRWPPAGLPWKPCPKDRALYHKNWASYIDFCSSSRAKPQILKTFRSQNPAILLRFDPDFFVICISI